MVHDGRPVLEQRTGGLHLSSSGAGFSRKLIFYNGSYLPGIFTGPVKFIGSGKTMSSPAESARHEDTRKKITNKAVSLNIVSTGCLTGSNCRVQRHLCLCIYTIVYVRQCMTALGHCDGCEKLRTINRQPVNTRSQRHLRR